MTLQDVEYLLSDISGDAYGADSTIRDHPFFQAVERVRQQIRIAVDEAADDANWEAFEKWQAGQPALDHSRCPDDGECLADATTGHTTAF